MLLLKLSRRLTVWQGRGLETTSPPSMFHLMLLEDSVTSAFSVTSAWVFLALDVQVRLKMNLF